MSARIIQFRQEKPPQVDPAETVVAVCIMAINLSTSLLDLSRWWRDHQSVLKDLPRDALAKVVAAKDRKKAALERGD